VHINNFDQNKMLVKKCADALNNSGILIINDYVMNEERTEPYAGALFSLNMLSGTSSGDTFTEGEMKEWLNEAGFTKIERKKTSFASDLLIGIK
jgi:hypothetical protein